MSSVAGESELLPAEGPEWVPSNHGKHLAASRLRTIADWLDAHEVPDHELVRASADGWDEARVHVKQQEFFRLMDGTPFTVDGAGHAVVVLDGMELVCVFK